MPYNGFGLGEGGEFLAQKFNRIPNVWFRKCEISNLVPKFIETTNVQLSTKALLLPTPGCMPFFKVGQ